MASPSTAPTLIGSVQRALRLLEAVGSHEGGAPAKQLARETGLPLATAYHLLRTLTHEGYLMREKGLFTLGDAARRLAEASSLQNRRGKIDGPPAHWWDAVGFPVCFAVYRDGEVELVAAVDHPATESAPALRERAGRREKDRARVISVPLIQDESTLLEVERLRDEIGEFLRSLVVSISI
ncbi:helix-turn-helix domain-containing protein [Streptomyces somaliensis DSM 40738]|uniref:Glycerol operon regulatory protein n=1 Tax=Streptomyces somaliensis (strain ATCC 33201 / DSM 40738 / JCM 12659 / KCTC 9044 / NCTC 11332 / NRRL B-12077 / IP 733) TaxID=1134445 RepID=A0AA44DAQ4_STRE0|nr:helix-turn-helix domain-containing protein [Streptomyces somaliensis]MCQ0024701.1 helix-turn-helix domain-containing protein [Streptomyces somaliensis DSM 40738]NKY13174.1 helix-turn-helix domain-containing protein [Streptomyces somaliensis DSM 40738]